MYLSQLDHLISEAGNFHTDSSSELEKFRVKWLGRKGIINALFNEFKEIDPSEKRRYGQRINHLKNLISQKIQDISSLSSEIKKDKDKIDLTLPSKDDSFGSRHPLSQIRNEIISIFSRIGFVLSEGPEIEDDWHVFSSLNFAFDHPARDMQDTFFIEKDPDVLLRTHTSSIQVRVMEKQEPPIRILSPGRVFRNEAISARAHCIFHQVEGLYIDRNVSFSDLKQTLLYFSQEMFGTDTKIRLRPSFFPFTEPSAEMDISCTICYGEGCPICKYTGWVEILGCGMVDPNVLTFNNINSIDFTGYAFGMGIERIAMLRYNVKDIRLFFENDVRFIDQFKTVF